MKRLALVLVFALVVVLVPSPSADADAGIGRCPPGQDLCVDVFFGQEVNLPGFGTVCIGYGYCVTTWCANHCGTASPPFPEEP